MNPWEPALPCPYHTDDDATHPLDRLPPDHPVWTGLLLGQKKVSPRFMAARILLAQLARNTRNDPTPETLGESILSLHGVYARNRNMPCAREDLAGFLADWRDKSGQPPPQRIAPGEMLPDAAGSPLPGASIGLPGNAPLEQGDQANSGTVTASSTRTASAGAKRTITPRWPALMMT